MNPSVNSELFILTVHLIRFNALAFSSQCCTYGSAIDHRISERLNSINADKSHRRLTARFPGQKRHGDAVQRVVVDAIRATWQNLQFESIIMGLATYGSSTLAVNVWSMYETPAR
jgi:hypothetical protein